jgi:hypothetical protein
MAKDLVVTIRESNESGAVIKNTVIITVNLDIIKLAAALRILHGFESHGAGTVQFADNVMNTKIGGEPKDIKSQTGGYSHLNNLLNPEYFKDLENKTNNAIDQTAGVSNTDDNMLMDERVNCDILSSLLVN